MSHVSTIGNELGPVDEADTQAQYEARQAYLAKRRRLLPIIAVIGLLLAWEAAVRGFDIKPFIAPAPSAVFQVLVDQFPMLMENLLPTATEAVLGFVIGNLAAVIVATSFVYRRTLEEAFFPIAVMINTIPVVAKAPILVLLMGNGLEPKIAIAALICFFPTLVNMTRGLRDVSEQHLELMEILNASPRQTFIMLRIRNALPYLFSAFKITSSTAVIGAIVGEWIGSEKGIGALIVQATFNFDSPLLYATIVVGSLLSVSLFGLVTAMERYFLSWNRAQQQ